MNKDKSNKVDICLILTKVCINIAEYDHFELAIFVCVGRKAVAHNTTYLDQFMQNIYRNLHITLEKAQLNLANFIYTICIY